MKKIILSSLSIVIVSSIAIFYSCQKEEIKTTLQPEKRITEKNLGNKQVENNIIPAIVADNLVKENEKDDNKRNTQTETQDKANSCSCSASGFWGSCSINCPIVHGVCLANCTTTSLLGGFLGTLAVCTCGSAGVGKNIINPGPETEFDAVNIENLLFLRDLISSKNSPKINNLKNSLTHLLSVSQHPDGIVRANGFRAFIIDLINLDLQEQQELAPHIQQQAITCGRN